MERLKLIVPETGHEFASVFMDAFPVMLNAEGATLELVELYTAAELGIALGVFFPVIAAVVDQWFALGAGYAAARADIAKENMTSGFSHGVVVGADRRKGEELKDLFWKFSATPNPFDEDAGKIAQDCYNRGLIAGFMQGRELSKPQREWFWKELGRLLGDQSYRGETSAWSRRDWIDWYITVGATFRRFMLA